ncbi:MAG TPA: hypothetical protein VFG43_14930 [Geminicoccaceae bacterium]|nr:hypothetical protein [Geminicoccaceae bacterium]
MHRHGFLLTPGQWRVDGIFLDAGGVAVAARGTVLIRHGPDSWHNLTRIELSTSPARAFENRYEIAPLVAAAASTPWRAFNAQFGAILGRFVLVEEMILSSFTSEDGRYQGGETFRRVDDGHYDNAGWLALGAEVLSRWRLDLHREESLPGDSQGS